MFLRYKDGLENSGGKGRLRGAASHGLAAEELCDIGNSWSIGALSLIKCAGQGEQRTGRVLCSLLLDKTWCTEHMAGTWVTWDTGSEEYSPWACFGDSTLR